MTDIKKRMKTIKPLGNYMDGEYSVQSLAILPNGKDAIMTGYGTSSPFLVKLATLSIEQVGSESSYSETIQDGTDDDMTFRNVNRLTPLPDGRIVMDDGLTLRSLTRDDDGVFTVETIAGRDKKDGYVDGEASEARFKFISSLAYNPAKDSIIIADNYRIRELNKDGIVSTLVGNRIKREASNDDLPDNFDVGMTASECSFSTINGMAVLSNGTILVADSEKLRQISVDGIISTIATFDHHIDGILVDADDNIYTSVVRFEDEDAFDGDDDDIKSTTAIVKVNAVSKTVVDVVPFGSQIDCGRLISFTKEGHIMVADSSGIVHIVETSCRLNKKVEDETVVMRRSKRLAVLRDEQIAKRRRRSLRLASSRDSCV